MTQIQQNLSSLRFIAILWYHYNKCMAVTDARLHIFKCMVGMIDKVGDGHAY